jgi:hypothetical protein
MSQPYRDGAGLACPRCGRPLLPDERGDAACLDGCGTWLSRDVVTKLLGVFQFAAIEAMPSWAEPLGHAPCPVCGDEEVVGTLDGGALICGRCPFHGAWVVRADRTAFTKAFWRPPPTAASLEDRVAAVEQRVAALERALRGR